MHKGDAARAQQRKKAGEEESTPLRQTPVSARPLAGLARTRPLAGLTRNLPQSRTHSNPPARRARNNGQTRGSAPTGCCRGLCGSLP